MLVIKSQKVITNTITRNIKQARSSEKAVITSRSIKTRTIRLYGCKHKKKYCATTLKVRRKRNITNLSK